MLDQIRRDIQARLDELLGEIERLRRALAALTSSAGESARGDRVAPASGAAGESVVKSAGARTRRTPRTSEKPAGSAAAGTRARTAPGATKTAVLVALGNGNAMTAGEIAAATGLHRASVSTTLSKLASSGQIAKAARGYQLTRESDTTRKPPRPRPSVSTVEPSPQAAEPQAAEPQAAEPQAAEPQAAGPARSAARPAPGATRQAVLAALAGGSVMTAGEVATATGLGRASVSSTLSQLAKAGELSKAAPR